MLCLDTSDGVSHWCDREKQENNLVRCVCLCVCVCILIYIVFKCTQVVAVDIQVHGYKLMLFSMLHCLIELTYLANFNNFNFWLYFYFFKFNMFLFLDCDLSFILFFYTCTYLLISPIAHRRFINLHILF